MTGSLASVHPELIPEWSEKNLPLTPDKITFGSNKRVWWKGACGHEWETSVKAQQKFINRMKEKNKKTGAVISMNSSAFLRFFVLKCNLYK